VISRDAEIYWSASRHRATLPRVVQFFGFHLMPWPYLPDEFAASGDSTWVTLSNENYDPVRGHELYARYLDELVEYERVGFDGICVNEHHQTAYGNIPTPNVMAALLVPRTTCKIAILGNAISLRDHPLRVAEEIAVLDVVSGGRIISGFVRGIGAEYHAFSLDPTQSRERFYEAHDLIVKAWSEPGPFEWYGKHYKLRYVNPWPRTFQRPHPPIWSPSLGSGETIDWSARNRYTYLQTYTDLGTLRRVFTELKETTLKYGYEAPPEQIGWSLPIYVADTDEQAVREARPHLEYLFNVGLRMPKDFFFPAGYVSTQSMARIMASKSGLVAGGMKIETLMEKGFVAVGSADTVREQIESVRRELGFGTLCANFHFATLPHELFVSSLHAFAEKVMPALRETADVAAA
jgi:alkanesulfonate monooxygenase SsuD/methylene tetrahydromethanopterin reductase-like flavin-dependent oxidoreductase (luciferase family)